MVQVTCELHLVFNSQTSNYKTKNINIIYKFDILDQIQMSKKNKYIL